MTYLNPWEEYLYYQSLHSTPHGICPVCDLARPLQEEQFQTDTIPVKLSLLSDHQTGLFVRRDCAGSGLLPVGAFQD